LSSLWFNHYFIGTLHFPSLSKITILNIAHILSGWLLGGGGSGLSWSPATETDCSSSTLGSLHKGNEAGGGACPKRVAEDAWACETLHRDSLSWLSGCIEWVFFFFFFFFFFFNYYAIFEFLNIIIIFSQSSLRLFLTKVKWKIWTLENHKSTKTCFLRNLVLHNVPDNFFGWSLNIFNLSLVIRDVEA